MRIVSETTSLSVNDFMSDIRNIYSLRMAIIEFVEAAASVGLELLRRRLKVYDIDGYPQIFRKLVEQGLLSENVGSAMVSLAKLRNLIVHRYWEVDDLRIYHEARKNGLEKARRFIEEVRNLYP
ncbi:MAG: DUF86 domain-containing protein [Aigarchaeota archaeon]|nr:DUF86 domain-containing protein [Candidatus Pelearchaeum maunauluense]